MNSIHFVQIERKWYLLLFTDCVEDYFASFSLWHSFHPENSIDFQLNFQIDLISEYKQI